MKTGKETEMYNQGYMDGYNDGEKAHINPDYWTRLEHQYAGMAMAGICANPSYDEVSYATMAEDAISAAHALVEKYKKEEK